MIEIVRRTWDRLRSTYWFISSLMAIGSVILAIAGAQLDKYYRDEALHKLGWIYSGGPEGARAVLSTIAGSIITVAGTTFSITIAALSLASAQFGPRLLRNFMRDTGNQITLGTFTSTFLYCVLVLRTVRGLEDDQYVPHISVTIGVLLSVFSLGILIFFIHHISESIQVAYLIDVVGKDLNDTVARLFPEHLGTPAETPAPDFCDGSTVLAHEHGYIQAVNEDGLVSLAEKHEVQLRLLGRPGDYVVKGTPLAISLPALGDSEVEDLQDAFTLGRDRTPYQDSVFAFLQLAEIALRALSPGINDPFTAITCIDRITSAMNELSQRSLPDPVRCDKSGKIRIVASPYDYNVLVEAAFRHIREAANGHWQVIRHLREKLEFLIGNASNVHFKAALRKELAALHGMQRNS